MKESTSHSRVVLPLHEQGIAIYSRKSRFTGKGESVGNQIELCRQYLRAHEPDAPEPEIFEDDGFSGGDLNRPAFRRMMRAAEAGRFRMLIVYRLDRISRSIGDFTALIERLAQLNVAFVSIREQFDTSTPMGRAMMYIASVFSQLERETIAERIRDNLRELAKTGRWLGGITPTGFASEAVQAVTVDGRTKRACRLRLLPEEAETVKAMYSLFARLGSLTAVVKGLQERGITTKNGNAFTRHAVRAMLCALPEDHAALAAALRGLRRGLPESSPAPPDRIPLALRDCLDTIRRTQRVLEALTEQLRWDGETLRVTLRRVDCK